MTSVLIVDDQQLLRRGLRLLLSTQPQIEVWGEADSGEQALVMLSAGLPDVVLSDARMPPGMSGVELTRRLGEQYPGLPVLILTTFDDQDVVVSAMRAGAAGFLLKDISPEQLAQAVVAASLGQVTIDPRVAATALGRQTTHDPLEGLTPTERRVAELLADGLKNQQIADALVLSVGTVKNHVSSLLRKLGHQDRTSLALFLNQGRDRLS